MLSTPTVVVWPLNLIPVELTIEIASWFPLSALLNFTNACKEFWILRQDRSLWLNVLKRTEDVHPLCCPIGTDIKRLSLEDLLDIAVHTHRVSCNWSREKPALAAKAVGRTIYTPSDTLIAPAAILSEIEGTSLAILYMHDEEEQRHSIVLCDVRKSVPVALYSPDGKVLRHSHYDRENHHLMAVVTDRFSILLFSVNYEDADRAEMICTYRDIGFGLHPSPFIALLLHQDNLGTIFIGRAGGLFLDLVNVQDEESRRRYVLNDDDANLENLSYLACTTVDDEVCLIASQVDTCHVYRLPGNLLHSSTSHTVRGAIERAKMVFLGSFKSAEDDDEGYDRETPDFQLSPLGLKIFNVFYRETSNGRSSHTYTTLWPFSPQHGMPLLPENKTNNPVFLGLVGVLGSHRYSLRAPWLTASSPSGIYTVMIVYSDRSLSEDRLLPANASLCLVKFSMGQPSVHHLQVPDGLDLREVYSIGIDERRGVIYFTLLHGLLIAAPYA